MTYTPNDWPHGCRCTNCNQPFKPGEAMRMLKNQDWLEPAHIICKL